MAKKAKRLYLVPKCRVMHTELGDLCGPVISYVNYGDGDGTQIIGGDWDPDVDGDPNLGKDNYWEENFEDFNFQYSINK